MLAVIVILAVIALIATPNVLSMIDMARKGAAESSALSYVDAIEKTVIVKMMNASSNISYDQKYSITGLTLTNYKDTVGDIKPCLNKTTNVGEDPKGENGACGTDQKRNPSFLTFNIELKGEQPARDAHSTVVVKNNVVVEAKMKFNRYRISYFYDKTKGDIRYCSTDDTSYLEKEACESAT